MANSRIIGNVKAVIKEPHKDKPSYVYVGRATQDDQGRIAVKIDSLPFDMTKWTGWLNIFPTDGGEPRQRPAGDKAPFGDFDDDIPF